MTKQEMLKLKKICDSIRKINAMKAKDSKIEVYELAGPKSKLEQIASKYNVKMISCKPWEFGIDSAVFEAPYNVLLKFLKSNDMQVDLDDPDSYNWLQK